jgi:predicted metal-dependent hydrolase
MALVINREGELVVRAPLRMPRREIDGFIARHESWIAKKQQQVKAVKEAYRTVSIETGACLPFLGKPYTLVRDDVSMVMLADTDATILMPERATRDELVAWLKGEAARVLTGRVEHYASAMGVGYSSLKLSGAQARWGSCSAKDSLNFAWRLILCPLDAIDYVVVHELSHVTHKNHGPEFWAQVRSVLPNYHGQRAWLRANRQLLQIL